MSSCWGYKQQFLRAQWSRCLLSIGIFSNGFFLVYVLRELLTFRSCCNCQQPVGDSPCPHALQTNLSTNHCQTFMQQTIPCGIPSLFSWRKFIALKLQTLLPDYGLGKMGLCCRFSLDILCDEPTRCFVLEHAYHSRLLHLLSVFVTKSCPSWLRTSTAGSEAVTVSLLHTFEKKLATTWAWSRSRHTRRCKDKKCVDRGTVSPLAKIDNEPPRFTTNTNPRCLVWNNP